jgi:long-chain acyl-CoA synthetase
MNVSEIMWRSSFLFPERTLVSFEQNNVSYKEFRDKAMRAANGLINMGIKSGDAVAIFASNSIDWLVCEFAIWGAGAIMVPINSLYSVDEAKYIIQHSESKAVIVEDSTLEKIKKVLPQFTEHINVITIEGATLEGSVAINDLINDHSPLRLPVYKDGEDGAAIYYTSGTTGSPKGCVVKHDGVYWGTSSFAQSMFKPREILVVCLPLAFVFASFEEVLPCLYAGGTIVLIRSFSPERTLQSIQDHKATLMMGVPTMYTMMIAYDKAGDYDISSLRWALCAGAVLSSELVSKFEDKFGVRLTDWYGLSEALCMAGWDFSETISTKPGSGGRGYPEAEWKVVDENDNELPIGEIGELVVRGPGVMKEYYKDPETTSKAMRGGYLHTGDMAKLDEDGCIYIVGRKKEVIKRGGINIFPSEIENVLYGHPDIAEAAVVSVPDELFMEEIRATIVLKSEAEANIEDIRSYCEDKLAKYKVPKYIELWDELPKGNTGKILKKRIQELPLKGA